MDTDIYGYARACTCVESENVKYIYGLRRGWHCSVVATWIPCRISRAEVYTNTFFFFGFHSNWKISLSLLFVVNVMNLLRVNCQKIESLMPRSEALKLYTLDAYFGVASVRSWKYLQAEPLWWIYHTVEQFRESGWFLTPHERAWK